LFALMLLLKSLFKPYTTVRASATPVFPRTFSASRVNMVKPESEVISEFNELVNMSADELEEWLKSDDSTSSGWKNDSSEGETVGHESGRKIVDILKRNPKKDEDKYTDEDVEHMRKVVSYCKRHLAQENKMKETKSPEELEQTKSTKSLKNWGHDPLK